MAEQKEYFAFISYQRKDEEWADRLRNKLEHYRLPSSVRKQDASLPKEIRPIFRDALELAGGVLAKEIETALQNSKYLIVICSPNSAKSPWVNKEIQTFIDLGREDKIIPFIIDGTPFSDNEDTECFPPALRSLKGEKELLGISINELSRDAAAIKVVARMFGLKFDMLWQRYEREQRRKRWIVIGSALLFTLVSLVIGGYIAKQSSALKEKDWKMMENQTRAVVGKANQLVDDGDSYLARLLLLEVLTKDVYVFAPQQLIHEIKDAFQKACRYQSALLENYEPVFALSLSDNDSLIASASKTKLNIWRINDGKCLTSIQNSNALVVALSNDSKTIVSSSGCDLKIWDCNTGEYQKTLSSHSDYVSSITFYNNNDKLASGSWDGTIKLWNVNDGICLMTLMGHSDKISSVAFDSNNNHVISASQDRTIKIWDVASGKCIKTLYGHMDNVSSIQISSRGKHIISASWDKTIRIWDTETGRCLKILQGHTDRISSISISSDNKYIVSASWDKTIKIWDLKTGICLMTLEGHKAKITSVAFTKDVRRVVSTSLDGTIRIWDINQYKKQIIVETGYENNYGYDSDIQCISYSPDNKRIASVKNHEKIKIWNVDTGEVLLDLSDFCYNVDYESLSFSPDGKNILSASIDNRLYIWDTYSGESIHYFEGHESVVLSAQYSPNGQRIVSASLDSTIKIWNARKDFELLKTIKMQNIAFSDASFNSDGTCIIAYAHTGGYGISIDEEKKEIKHYNNGEFISYVYIWDVAAQKVRTIYRDYYNHMRPSVYSPDKKQIVLISGKEKSIAILDSNTGEKLVTIPDYPIYAYFISNGKRILSVSNNNIKIWNSSNGKCIKTLNLKEIDNLNIKNAEISRDEKRLIISSGKDIYMLEFETGNIIDLIKRNKPNFESSEIELHNLIDETRERFKNRPLTPEERRKYYLE